MARARHAPGLNVGDRIRIVGLPGEGVPGYVLQPCTRQVYRKLIARRRSVRIAEVDEYGSAWFWCRFRTREGWEFHSSAVDDFDAHWVRVKPRSPLAD